MTDGRHVTMVARWEAQRRFVNINIDDNIQTIEKVIIDTYQLPRANSLSGYQIQYYDTDHECFIDLYSETFVLFKQLLSKLSSSDAPQKSTKTWTLKIISKTLGTTCNALYKSATTDIYNDQIEPVQEEKSSFRKDDAESLSSTDSLYTPASQNIDENQSPHSMITTNPEINTPHNHPYDLHFYCNLADQQRCQFECEMLRKHSSKISTAGVLLRAAYQPNTDSNEDSLYPTVHFRIPKEKCHLHWSLYIYILTEADTNGIHYLHASKGIFDHCTKQQDKFGLILNTNLVNPYVVHLTEDDLQNGKYQIRIKVCNIRNVCTHKRERLRVFPRLDTTVIYDDENLLSTKTTCELKFSSDKYHVGCLLIHQNEVYDRCVSSGTVANRKRRETDKSNDEENRGKRARNLKTRCC